MREASYEIRVRGRVSSAVLERLEGMQGGPEAASRRSSTGPVRDQAELHGLLARVRALGLELVEVRRLPLSRWEQAPLPAPLGLQRETTPVPEST